MQLTMMKAKLHRACVTQCDLNYEGSISIDRDLIEAAGFYPYEQVDVLNINSGDRFTTYVLPAPRGSGMIGINGAAARLAQKGDRVIILSYVMMDKHMAARHEPVVVLLNENNERVEDSSVQHI